MPKRVPRITNLLISKQLLKKLVFYKQQKPIKLIGWFLRLRIYLVADIVYIIINSLTQRRKEFDVED